MKLNFAVGYGLAVALASLAHGTAADQQERKAGPRSNQSNNIADRGGGIYNTGMLTVTGSTVSGNIAEIGVGAGMYSTGTLAVSNSTISGNRAEPGILGGAGWGGGIFNSSSGTLTVTGSTVAKNTAATFGGEGYGGGIFNQGTINLRNTVLAENSGNQGPDLWGGLAASGHNLFGNSSGGSGYDKTDLVNVNPLLGPLQDNGGATFTQALLPGSPAIDAGDPDFIGPPDFDQRGEGFPRIVNGIVDIGAFEVQAP